MRYLFVLLTAAIAATSSTASAQRGGIPKGYYCGAEHILHRTPKGVLDGLPQINRPCVPNGSVPPLPKPSYSLATPSQVVAALDCDFSAAAKATRGKSLDISKAVITGYLKLSQVTKDSKGLSLSVAAIPVFAGGSIAPSVEASNLSETTLSDEMWISMDPAVIPTCASPSKNKWLTSKLMMDTAGPTKIDKREIKVSFVVTKQGRISRT